ncbi:MAG: hypothetical protein C0506_11695 [Anaerolinea sp.]|nr:hypothetical protein [Anaerolinea sp.]
MSAAQSAKLPRKDRSSARIWTLSAALTLGFAFAMNLIWWSMLSPAANPGVKEWVIPEGTAAAMESGGAFPFLPNAFSIPAGAKVLVVNRDVVDHQIGSQTIPARSTAALQGLADGSFSCTIHPSGALSITLNARPSIFSTIIPTLALGLPLTLMVGIAVSIVSRLDL